MLYWCTKNEPTFEEVSLSRDDVLPYDDANACGNNKLSASEVNDDLNDKRIVASEKKYGHTLEELPINNENRKTENLFVSDTKKTSPNNNEVILE